MAFGLGFNKAKILAAAEKFVIQGKIPAAILEYRKILDKDPKDLMVLNTVADLCVRAGQTTEAQKLFYELAEKFVEGGFLHRGIAVYKRITKIDPESIPAVLKLGELYSMQGLMRDSRSYYLQAVDYHMRRKEMEKAQDVFERVLLLDSENPKLHARMAELYAETGKKEEAIAAYLGAVERFLDRQQVADAHAALDGLFRLDSGNIEGKMLLGRCYLEESDIAKAIETLESVPALVSHKGALNLLFHAYTKRGDEATAREVARKIFDLHEDFAGLAQICEELTSKGELDQAEEIYRKATPRLIAQRATHNLVQGLRKILVLDPSHVGTLELMLDIYKQTGDRAEIRETTELLAHACVSGGQLERARDLYAELVAMEPENRDHRRLLQQVESRLPGAAHAPAVPPPPTAETPVAMAAELEIDLSPPAAAGTEVLTSSEQTVVKNTLTEADLYVTYRQLSKAIATLEGGLAQLPGNITLNEHLLGLYEQSGRYQDASNCCEALVEAYVRLGDGERASRYGERIAGLQQKALEALPAEAPVMAAPVEEPPQAGVPPADGQSQVREIDLSLEWNSMAATEPAAAPAAPSDESAVEEIEFYLQAGLLTDARDALDRLERQNPSHPSLASFRERLAPSGVGEAAVPAEAATGAVEVDLTSAWESAPAAAPEVEVPFLPVETEVLVQQPVPEPAEPSVFQMEISAPAAPEAEIEEEAAPEPALELEMAASAPEPGAAPPSESFELSLEEAAPAEAAELQPADRFASLAGELEDALEISAPVAPPTKAAAPAAPVAPTPAAAPSAAGSPLEDVFAEFRDEMEEPAAAEDLETHYNMGVAFKEMALYDEAIGEFQKVHQIAEKAKDHTHLVRCCSLLALCFQEKGLPQLAVRWYQTALDSPGLDSETSLALLYEMACAYELAGDRPAALQRFLEVYSRNIDYRNVSERIRTLQQAP